MLFFELKEYEKEDFLTSIIIYLKQGLSFKNSIKEIQNSEENKNIIKITKKIYQDLEDGLQESETLKKNKIIEEYEEEIINQIKGFGLEKTLTIILKDKHKKNEVNQLLLSIISPIFIMLISVSILIFFTKDFLLEKLIGIQSTFINNNSIDVLPWFLKIESKLIIYFIIFLILFFISLVITYKYLDNNNKKILFKYFKIKRYEETPLVLNILRNLKLTPEINLYKAFGIMKNLKKLKGYNNLFEDLQNAELQNKKIYKEFVKYNFPSVITNILKRAKEKLDFFEGFDDINKYCQTQFSRSLKKYKSVYKKISIYITFLIPLYIIIHLYFVLFNILLELLEKSL